MVRLSVETLRCMVAVAVSACAASSTGVSDWDRRFGIAAGSDGPMAGWPPVPTTTCGAYAEAGPEVDEEECKSLDSDGDGVPDAVDGAPLLAEDADGFQDEDGIPDPVNSSSAGAANPDSKKAGEGEAAASGGKGKDRGRKKEAARAKKGSESGGEAASGDGEYAGSDDAIKITATDLDSDGITDLDDLCVEQPEDRDDFQDDDGCPDNDNDYDGTPDAEDECPNRAGECGPLTLKVKGKIAFKPGKSSLNMTASKGALEEILGQLEKKPTLRIEIQGHTDNSGNPKLNLRISTKRAKAVRAYLVSEGVDPARLVSKGYGDKRPIADNGTAAGRKKNRRVEFHVVK